uniref:Uncharacterized protein n=1 Tax=Anopheles epiroticus TaxID=199890 RepID=A0A182P0V6_9DIPT
MVSMDGEAHPNMTLAAVGLGALVALIILLTLIAFITRRERSSQSKELAQQSTTLPATVPGRRKGTIELQPPAQKTPPGGSVPPRCVTFTNDLELVDVVVTRM